MSGIKPIILSIFLISFLPAIYFCFVLTIGLMKPYSWRDMDWNRDGSTSIGEVFVAADTGTWDVKWQGQTCSEIFAFKDGLTLNLKCGEEDIGPQEFGDVVR